MKKRFLLFSIIFIAAVIVTGLVYTFVVNRSEEETPAEIKLYDINIIVEEEIISPQVLDDEVYYLATGDNSYNKAYWDGQAYQTEKLGDIPLGDIRGIHLAPSKKVVLLETTAGLFYTYSLDNKQTKTLDSNITSAVWHPASEKDEIFYTYYNFPRSNINLLDLNNGEREELVDLRVNEGIINDVSSDGQKLSYWRLGPVDELTEDNHEAGNEEFIIFDVEQKKDVIVKDNIVDAVLGPDQEKLLIETTGGGVFPSLFLFDTNEDEYSPLNLNTYFNKVAFSSDPDIILYGRVEGHEVFGTSDALWKENIATGEKQPLTRLDNNSQIEIVNIITSSDNKRIYFQNKQSGALCVINID